MKKILTLGLCSLLALNTNAQCIAECSTTETFTEVLPTIGGYSNYNTSMCFHTYGSYSTITTGTNWNNWNYLSFYAEDNILTINQAINMNQNKKVYLKHSWGGNIIANYISMAGDDTIYVGSNVTINTLISNHSFDHSPPKVNAVMLENYSDNVTVSGIPYYVGDTIFAGTGTGKKVIVSYCEDNPLNILITDFKIDNDRIIWSLNYPSQVILEGSYDGVRFYKITETTNTNSPITNHTYYRLNVNSTYSKTIKYVSSNNSNSYIIYDITGREVNENNLSQGIYIKVYKNGRIEKIRNN